MSTETDLSNCFRDIEPLFFSLSLILPLSFHFCFFHSLSLFLSTYPILSYPHPTYHEERLHLILAPFLFFSFSAISSLSPYSPSSYTSSISSLSLFFNLVAQSFFFLSQSLLHSLPTSLSVFSSISLSIPHLQDRVASRTQQLCQESELRNMLVDVVRRPAYVSSYLQTPL